MPPEEVNPLDRVDVPEGVPTERDMRNFYRESPHRPAIETFSLPEGVKFEVDLSEVERTRWTPEEYDA